MGLATPLEAWNETQYLIHEGNTKYQSVAFDNSGSGLSCVSSFMSQSIHSMSVDAWDLVQNCLKWNDVHIVAVSMGGMIAMEMCLARPHRFVDYRY